MKMLNTEKALIDGGYRSYPAIQVHDEAIFVVYLDEFKDLIRLIPETMEINELFITITTGKEVGRNFGDRHETLDEMLGS